MKKRLIEMAARAADSFPITETMESNSLFTRREMLGMAGMAGLTALTGIVPDAVAADCAKTASRIALSLSAIGVSRLPMRTGSYAS